MKIRFIILRIKRNAHSNFLRINLKGSESNRRDYWKQKLSFTMIREEFNMLNKSVYRGFLSSVEEIPHFGLGNSCRC